MHLFLLPIGATPMPSGLPRYHYILAYSLLLVPSILLTIPFSGDPYKLLEGGDQGFIQGGEGSPGIFPPQPQFPPPPPPEILKICIVSLFTCRH